MMQTPWTHAQILGLAPDHYTIKTARNITQPHKWDQLGFSGDVVWGVHAAARGQTTQVAADLAQGIFSCSCRSKKKPCRFSLALLLMWEREPDAFMAGEPPAWLPQAQPNGRSPLPSSHDPQLAQLRQGMQELALWLQDMVHQGYATLPHKPKTYWETLPHRLVDNQAPRLAGMVKQLATLPKTDTHSGWPSEMLQACGRLYLYTQAWERYPELTVDQQADLIQFAGGNSGLGPSANSLSDTWRVVGRLFEPQERGSLRHTWLWGKKSRRYIQLTDTLGSTTAFQPVWPTDSQIDAQAHLFPSQTPQLAQLTDVAWAKPGAANFSPPTILSWERAHAALTDRLAQNPWLPYSPVVLAEVTIEKDSDRWQLRDRSGSPIPLQPDLRFGWHLLALSATNPLTLFGVWNGRSLHLLSFLDAGCWTDCHILGGLQ